MKRLSVPVLALILSLSLVACGGTDTKDTSGGGQSTSEKSDSSQDSASKAKLDAFVAKVDPQVKKQVGTFNGLYSEVGVEPDYPSGIEYVYVYAKPVDAAVAAKELAKQAPTLQTVFDKQVAPDLKANGFSKPTAKYTFRNPDNSVIWSRTFDES